MDNQTIPGTISVVKVQLVREKEMPYQSLHIQSPREAVSLIRDYMGDLDRENFVLLCLNTKAVPTHIETVHIGTINKSIISPREVMKTAILSNAASVMVFHNHPSGDPEPSREDLLITERLKDAFDIVGIDFFDHIVIGEEDFTSIREYTHLNTNSIW